MFLKTPARSDIGLTNSTERWQATYSAMVSEVMYPVTITVLFVKPSYEVLEAFLDTDEELRDHRMFDYTNQMVMQQGLSEFMEYAEEQKKIVKRTDDPLFER